MKSTARTAALAFGLTIAGTCSFGSSTARAQSYYPSTPAGTYYVVAPRTYVPVAPRYVGVPTYYYPSTATRIVPGPREYVHSPNYNYESARRDLKLYKPWLQH